MAPPPPLPKTLFGWVSIVYNMEDEEYFRLVGLDAYVLYRFMRLCCLLNVEFVVFGMFILTPVYYHGNGGYSDLNRITLSNLSNNSGLIVVAILFAWIYCFHFFWVVGKEMQVLAQLRRGFLARGNI